MANRKEPEKYLPASMAQLDARPTGDHEVAGSTPHPSLQRSFMETDHEMIF